MSQKNENKPAENDSEQVLKHMLSILKFDQQNLQAFLDNALNEMLALTQSHFGYIYQYEEAAKQLVLKSWSNEVMKSCAVVNPQTCYELGKTGIWGEAVRQRKPIIINDFQKRHPLKKGYPEGHVELQRYMTIPVFDQGKIVAVVGLANRKAPYTDADVPQLNLIMAAIWKVVILNESLQRENHLKKVLLGIRNVNQMITKVNDPAELIRESCKNVTAAFGYLNAWIMLMDKKQKMTDFASAGSDEGCGELEMLLSKGFQTSCVKRALQEDGLVTFNAAKINCADCPMATIDVKKAAMSRALRYQGEVYGVITVWVPARFIHLEEEKELFQELTGDIAFALYKINLEKERNKLEKNLYERNKELNCLLQIRQEMQIEQPEGIFIHHLIEHMKTVFRFPDKLEVVITLEQKKYGVIRDASPQNTLTADIKVGIDSEAIGKIVLTYNGKSAFFLPEEQRLLNHIALMVSQWFEHTQAQEHLRFSEEHLAMTLQSIGDGVLATDLNGKITRMNAIAGKFTGYQQEEAKGKNIQDVFKIVNAETREAVINPIEKVFKTGNIVGLANHTVLISKNGNEYQISDSAAPIRDKNGKIHGVILVFSDVTEQYQRIKAVTESEARFKKFFETVPGAVSITEVETGKYIDVNPAFERLSGYKKEELIGKTSLEINIWANPNDRTRFVEALKSSNIVSNMEATFITKSGADLYGLMSATFAEFNGKSHIVLIVNDITDLHMARLGIHKSNTILEQLPASVLITDKEFRIEYCNSYTLSITGFSEEEIVDKTLGEFVNMHFFETYKQEILNQLYDGRVWSGEYQAYKADGTSFWISASISPVHDFQGELINFIVVQQDTSEQKKLMKALTEAKESAESGDKLKTAFMNNISHEIRTPLNSILGFGELLINETNFQPEERNLYLKMVEQSSQRLMQTITDYMDISLISSGNMKVYNHTFCVNELFNKLFEYFNERLINSFVRLEMDIPVEVVTMYSDAEHLEKVMSHLIDNALKFTPRGKVRFGFKSIENGIACFVEDTGIGIDRKMQQQVFDFFVQENHENTRGHEGSGLGLAIVKGLTEILGGKVEVQSEKQKGTKIKVILPSEKQGVQKNVIKETPVMQQTEGKQKMILIAEDEDTNFFVIDLFIRKSLNMATIRAKNGIEAVELFKQHPEIILVLMDIKMPVMDGIEATHKIKAINPDMPVIAITAYALYGDELKLRMAGCDDYIAKPVQKKELLRKIDKILGNN